MSNSANRDIKGDGNSIHPPQINQCKNWFFTLNNYTLSDIETIDTTFKRLCKTYIFQEETGSNGTPHLQGSIILKKKMRWSEFKLNKNIHWEKTRNSSASIDYCCKVETRTGNIYTNIEQPEEIECIKKEQLKEWQKEFVEWCQTKPEPRTIIWAVDKEGNKGKSELCRYLCINHKAICIAGKCNDMKYGIMKYIEKNKRGPKIILIDLPRTYDNEYLSYTGIEEIKNGMFYNTKYESEQVIFNRPHVIIFSNDEPKKESLSKDRWKIMHL